MSLCLNLGQLATRAGDNPWLPFPAVPNDSIKGWTSLNGINGNIVTFNSVTNKATMFQKYGAGGSANFRSVYIICHQVLSRFNPSATNFTFRVGYTIYQNTNGVKLMLEYQDALSGGFASIQLPTSANSYPATFTQDFTNSGKDDLSIRVQEDTTNPQDTGCIIGAINLRKLY
tara:strand:- start:4 stop:522 length:519 start_codon:yes stop_codon:yes gene_type:complete